MARLPFWSVPQPANATSPSGLPAQQHAEKVAWFVRVGEQVQLFIKAMIGDLITHIAQGREVFDGEADGVKNRYLPAVAAPGGEAGDDLPHLSHLVPAIKLLDFTFDTGLRRILHEDVGA
jgi:hypothetical protein